MKDHLHDEALFWWSQELTYLDVRRHTILTLKNWIWLEARVPVPKDKSPQIDVLNNSFFSSSASEISYEIRIEIILPEKIEFSNWQMFFF